MIKILTVIIIISEFSEKIQEIKKWWIEKESRHLNE